MGKKILMVTMSMDIGGAETHILELSKGLKLRGYEVFVASNGGKYVPQLEDFGIKHYKLPLHDKRIGHVIKAYKGLKKIISQEKIDVVHVHARIPGYICGKLRKRMEFKFVTTVHGKFKTSLILNFLTNWGEKALAVSDDIYDYLVDNYHLKPHNIKMTVNGINTDVFNEKVQAKNIKNIERFDNGFNLLHVSRFEDTTDETCICLINIADKLVNKINNLNIIIVGDGDSFYKIKAMAAEKNKIIGRDVIFVEGAQTIVNEYISISHLFVGISRAALEAMAMKKPVLLSGNYGYLGLFDERKTETAIRTNFTCRGIGKVSEQQLYKDIIDMVLLKSDKLISIGEFEKNIVEDNYSVDRMVDDAINLYDSSNAINFKSGDFDISIDVNRKCKVLVFGYIGFNNSGDDALFDIFSSNFLRKYQNAEITVLANSKRHIKNIDRIKYLYCFNVFSILRGIIKSDLVIANGGSLLQDDTSSRSLYYYLNIINIAKLFKKKIVMISNGLGPIKKKSNRRLVSKVVNKVDLITFRDRESVILSDKLGINKPDIYETIDLVFGYENKLAKDKIKDIFDREHVPLDKKLVGIVVRPWKEDKELFDKLAKVCDNLYERKNVNILFIPLQQSKRINDLEASAEIAKLMKNKSYTLKNIYDYEKITGIISNLEIIISMRLHSVIYSLVQGIPVYGIAYQSKVKHYLEEMDLPFEDNLSQIDIEKLTCNSIELIDNKDVISENIKNNIKIYREKAKENLVILYNYIEKWRL